MEFYHREDKTIKSLVRMAVNGYYPIFTAEWLIDVSGDKKKLTGNEKLKAKKLFCQITTQPSLERQKAILLSMKIHDRKLFVKAFIKMVEHEILNQKLIIH